ncbi:unnamed protein product [Cylindrotheca closterium]|uniref:Uncharacterized protein n=1 Tax=Cylindrotheca closterium TaxID=2856 RepID=A0AAD2CN16_9STRA|nr:unnamed protein product [Cylindrotheca closterium]
MASPSRLPFQSPSAESRSQLLEGMRLKTPSTINKNNRSYLSAITPVQPVFTPSGTPRGSHVLLSPSRTITETLNALASSTAHQLEEIWDQVGYSPQDRATQLKELLMSFRDQCDQTISQELGVVETFRQEISEAKKELKAIGEALKTPIDPRLVEDNHEMTLINELETLQVTLDGLRADVEVAKADMRECQEQLIESHLALGLDLESKWDDIETDLTQSRRGEFHLKVEEMKHEVTNRTSTIIQLLRDCQHLMSDLAIDAQASDSTLDRQIAGSLARSKDSSFIMSSKFETESCTGISISALERLTERVAELQKEKKSRKTKLQEMGAEIAMLWEQLRIPEDEQKSFSESVKGLGMDTIRKGEGELKRLKQLKNEMLGSLIEEARESIYQLWQETNATATTKEEFDGIDVIDQELYDNELLEAHEEYLHILQERFEHMKPILQLIERREDILRQRSEYEELQKDSSRLNQRGAAMAKQLMEEEKMARRIKKELPKLTKLLTEKLSEWKERNKEDFQYQGEIYVNVIKAQNDEWQRHKEEEMQNKRKKKQGQQGDENKAGSSKAKVTTKASAQQSRPRTTTRRQPLASKKNALV